jgi:hypothetical protein
VLSGIGRGPSYVYFSGIVNRSQPRRAFRLRPRVVEAVRTAFRLAIITLVATAALVAVIDGLARSVSEHYESHIRLVLGAIAVVVMAAGAWSRFSKFLATWSTASRQPVIAHAGRLPAQDLFGSRATLVSRYGERGVKAFLYLFIYPQLFIVRAIEEARIVEQTLRLEVSLTLDIAAFSGGSSGQSSLIIPLIRTNKGDLLDNLELRDAQDISLATLPQADIKALISFALEGLFQSAYADVIGPTDPQAHELLGELDLLASTIDPVPEIAASIVDKLEKLESGSTLSDEQKGFAKRLKDACRFLAESYVVAVEAPYPEGCRHLIVRYSKSMPVFTEANTAKSRWRLRLGLRPDRFHIPIHLQSLSRSYHFRMNATPGQYVSRCFLAELDSLERVEPADIAPHGTNTRERQPVVRYSNNGLPWAHIYTKYFNLEPRDLSAFVKFYEVPPGILGAAALVTLATTALIITFTFARVSEGGETGSDLPALLLALPAILASWVGYKSDSDNLLRTSLTARVGLILAGTLSFASALLYIIQRTGKWQEPHWTVSLLGGTLALGRASVYWVLLSAAALALTVVLGRTLWVRGRRYMGIVRALSMRDYSHLARS